MNGLISKMKSNWQAGITVALVSIPLSVSLALAAGATPQMGIITAVWAGLAAAILGGSSFNIVGPTGALSGILAAYALSHGVETLPLLAILSGVLILIVFVLKLERYIVLIPASVIHGFTLGVALIIGLGQLNSAFGISPKQIHESFIGNLFETFGHIGDFVLASTVFTIAGVVFLHVLSKFLPKFPAAIILTMLGIVLGMLTEKNICDMNLATIDSKYGEI